MNKEQLLEEVRSGKLAIENDPTFKDNTLDELRECLCAVFDRNKVRSRGKYNYYFSYDIEDRFLPSDFTKLPTIKVCEALQILKEPNMEEQIKELQLKITALEYKFEVMLFDSPKIKSTSKLGTPKTVGELKRLLTFYQDNIEFGFRNQPMQDLYEVKDGDKTYIVFQ